jgi:hypothetical protein
MFKKLFFSIFFIFCLANFAIASQWPARGLTGGGDALDGINHSSLGDGDIALVYSLSGTEGVHLWYTYDSDYNPGTREQVPEWIDPNSLAGSGAGRWVLNESSYRQLTWVVEDPVAGEHLGGVRFEHSAYIIKVVGVIVGGTSVTIRIEYDSDRSQDGTLVFDNNKTVNSQTTGNVFTVASGDLHSTNRVVSPSDVWLWLETTNISGSVSELSVTVFYVYW